MKYNELINKCQVFLDLFLVFLTAILRQQIWGMTVVLFQA